MELIFLFVGLFLINSIQCHDSGSYESSLNGMDLSPFYDTIIYSDIADIMKDFEISNIPLFTKIAKEDSESDENVEDLLREYQEYLDKEHKQRKDYIERTKIKNKVPLLRHDRFSKINFGNGGKHGDYNMYKNNYYNIQNSHKSKNSLDLFLPVKSNGQYGTVEVTTTLPRNSMELNTFKKIMLSEEGRSPSLFPKIMFPQSAPCCKSGQFMVMNACKQCMTAKDYSRSRLEPKVSMSSDDKRSDNLESDLADPDDALNIRIKIDVQLPKINDRLDKHQINFVPDDAQKEFPLAIKMPSTYYNVPLPLNLYGYKKVSKSFSSPLHKLTIHKKKKSKSTTNGKKHRKKVITFHNIKMDPQQIYEAHFGKTTSDGFTDDTQPTDSTDIVSSTTNILETNKTTTERLENLNLNETQTEENVFLLLNISNNEGEESNKTNNSIETEYANPKLNVTTETTVLLRKKRGISADNNNKSDIGAHKTTSEKSYKTKIISKNVTKAFERTTKLETKVVQLNKTAPRDEQDINISKVYKDNTKKADRNFYIEEDLLYWPNKNESQSKVLSKNITTIILESESKKGKLNLTKESMRKNHTRVLEKAIFGDVDWNDVDAVAPAFMSFIGKYIEGALTFCSEVICHSMKCGQKVCHHRVCTPTDRFNNKGHCMGANNTDSIATMESIMDLPTNIVFEIVDILQDKMAGMMFGKMTLCISPKCITFVSSKKRFTKFKCIAKELNPKGHCVNTKEGKSA